MLQKKIAIILNAQSGNTATAALVGQIKEAFAPYSMTPKISLVHSGSDLNHVAKISLEEGYSIIVAAGGDGTINAVASNLIGSPAALGILPVGTFNHFAKDLNIPLTLAEAARVILTGKMIKVDVGQVNDRVFINNSSIGIYPQIVRSREELERQGQAKWRAFISAILIALRLYPVLRVRLVMNGKEILTDTPFVFVGNNDYSIQGLKIGSRTSLTDHFLSVFVAHRPTRWRLLHLVWHVWLGNLAEQDDFDVYQTPQVQIETWKKYLHVSFDGEVVAMATPLKFQIIPKTLQVIIPS